MASDRKSTRLNSSHTVIYTLSLHDALPIFPSPLTLALFCKVVDNYGDIGICWRLARQLQQEHGVAVTLCVDDLLSFQRICPAVAPDAALQQLDGVTVRHWR